MREIGNTQIILLVAGASVPVLYFGTILIASLFYPGYTQVRQFASELGAHGPPHTTIFNLGMITYGCAEMAASQGIFGACR